MRFALANCTLRLFLPRFKLFLLPKSLKKVLKMVTHKITDVKRSGVEFTYREKEVGRNKDWIYFNKPKRLNVAEITLEFSTMAVSVSTEVPLVDLVTFVSGVGGAMGLFLGFSIIDALLYTYNFLEKSAKL